MVSLALSPITGPPSVPKPTAVLAAALPALEALSSWTSADIEAALQASLVDGLGLKPRNAYGPLRVAVTGRIVSPPLFESMELLGRPRSLERIRAASDDILEGGVALVGELDGVPEALAQTDRTVQDIATGGVRYAGSVGKLLG